MPFRYITLISDFRSISYLLLLTLISIFFADMLSCSSGMDSEGMLWFPDLTQPDPIFLLPLMLGCSSLLNLEVSCLLIRPNKLTQSLHCTSLSFGHNVISYTTTAKNLGFHLTDDMRIDAHVQDICRNVYIDIRRISSIRHLLYIDAAKTMLSAFALPKFDYCNSLFHGIQMYMLERLQKVHTSAEWLIFQCLKQNHITPLLMSALAAN